MRRRQSKISSQVQQTPSRINRGYDHIIPLLQMNGFTVLLLCVILLISRRFCRLNYGGIPFIRTVSVRSLHIQCFYTGGKLTSCNVDTNISHKKRCGLFERKINKHRTPLPALRYFTTLPAAPPPNVRYFFIKIRQSRPFKISTLMRKNFMWKLRLLSSSSMTSGIIQTWRFIFVLQPSNFQSRKRFEVWITFEKVLSIDLAIFIIKISNAFFNT